MEPQVPCAAGSLAPSARAMSRILDSVSRILHCMLAGTGPRTTRFDGGPTRWSQRRDLMRSRVKKIEPYKKPSGGWGAARAVSEILWREGAPVRGGLALRRQNKVGEFKCVSCAWAKPAKPHVIEVCENGAKGTAWELTAKRVTPEFFAAHTLTELARWADHDLEALGRLTHPLRWDASSDKYVPMAWDAAFREIGRELRVQDPKQVVFSRPLTCTSCWRVCSAATTCRTAPTCATRAHQWHCQNRSACRWERLRWTTFPRPNACSSSMRMSGPTHRACCMTYSTRESETCRSSRSIRSASEDSNGFKTRSPRFRC
jgi:hypothetical protein